MSDEDELHQTPDIVRDDFASRRQPQLTPSVQHFLPQTDNTAYFEKYRNTESRVDHSTLEAIRREEAQNEEEIANSLNAWKERRKRKSQIARERVGENIHTRVPEFHNPSPPLSSTTKSPTTVGNRNRYKELAARYAEEPDTPTQCDEDPRVLDVSNFDDQLSDSSEERFEEEKPLEIHIERGEPIDVQSLNGKEAMPMRANNFQCFNINVEKQNSNDQGVASRCEIPPTVAVKPNNFNSRPVVESLASQLQRQKISAEGASGYSKFKNDFQRAMSTEEADGSPLPRPSEFQQKRKQQFASKKALFEQTNGNGAEMGHKNDRQSLPGAGVVQNARNSLFNREPEFSVAKPVSLVDKPRPSSAEKYRRDIRLQAVDEAHFPDPPAHHSDSPKRDFGHDEEIHADHIYSHPSQPVRSVSEHRFKETKPVELATRANSCPDENELYSEVTVCMSQRPGSSRGFGFQVRGGDGRSPIIVDAIKPGGAAHVCELSVGDEVLTMNGMTVSNLTQEQIVELMVEAVRTGQLRLRARRYNQLPKKKQPAAPSLRLTSAAKMVATEGGFYQILADIPKKHNRDPPNRPQPSPSPAGTLDSGHGSEQTGDARESPVRSPTSSPSNSSPSHSPRRNQEEVRWMEELDNFELLEERNNYLTKQHRTPAEVSHSHQFNLDSGRKTWQNPSSARHNYSQSDDLAAVLAIEQEEYERELEDKERRRHLQREDDYTEEQIRKIRDSVMETTQSRPRAGASRNGTNSGNHWMVREAEMRRQNYTVRK